MFEYWMMGLVKYFLTVISITSRYQLHMLKFFIFLYEVCVILPPVWLVLKPFIQLLKFNNA